VEVPVDHMELVLLMPVLTMAVAVEMQTDQPIVPVVAEETHLVQEVLSPEGLEYGT
jgi:hypothetical protein